MNERICLFMNNSSNVHRYRSIGHRFFFSEFIDSLPASDGESRNLIFDFQIHSFYVVLLVLAIVLRVIPRLCSIYQVLRPPSDMRTIIIIFPRF